MSRVYEAAMEAGLGGEWRYRPCPECAGSNQRSNMVSGVLNWWFGNADDTVCCLCRAELEAAEQQAWMDENDRDDEGYDPYSNTYTDDC